VSFPRTTQFRNLSITSPALYQLSQAAANRAVKELFFKTKRNGFKTTEMKKINHHRLKPGTCYGLPQNERV